MEKFEIRAPEFHDVIAQDAELEIVAEGFTFVEGPIWHPDDHYLIFSDIAESSQYQWSKGDGLEIFRYPSNQANGNFFDRGGRVISCEHATSQVVRHEHGGKVVRPIATHFEGKELNSPNDIVCDSKGRIWFTDPAFGRLREDLGILRDQELGFQGVYRLDLDNSPHAVATDFKQPNGLCLSLNEHQLYVNDSWDPSIRVFDIETDGSLSGGEIWATVEGESGPTPKWVPDGLKVSMTGICSAMVPEGFMFSTAKPIASVLSLYRKRAPISVLVAANAIGSTSRRPHAFTG